MTDATTADVLAAWELIEEHDITVRPRYGDGGAGWSAWEWPDRRNIGNGDTPIAAVRAWAEAAGVPWPSANVVPMLAVMECVDAQTAAQTAAQPCGVQLVAQPCDEDMVRHLYGDRVVPCEVVIRTETEGV